MLRRKCWFFFLVRKSLWNTMLKEWNQKEGNRKRKLLRCVAVSLNLSLLPLITISAQFCADEKFLGSERCDVSALGWKVEKKTLLAILWFGFDFDLLYFKWVYSCDFFCDSEVCEKWINLSLFTVRPQKRAKKSPYFKREWRKSLYKLLLFYKCLSVAITLLKCKREI